MDILGHFRKKFNSQEFQHSQSEIEFADYQHPASSGTNPVGWTDPYVRYQMADWLDEQYAIHLKTPSKVDEGITFFKRGNMTGFAIHPGYFPFEEQDLCMLSDYLRDRVLLLPYYIHLSETRTKTRKEWTERSKVHKLLPDDLRDGEGRHIQQFGHIAIEMTEKDNHIVNLEFTCFAQSGPKFTKPQPFEVLMSVLTGS